MTAVSLVVHGHFYQPPREDPWTGIVPEQPSAAPFRDWNERVTAECYRPNAELGAFELLSFNVGPTLMSWLEPHHPDVYERIVAADRATGRAIAQAYGHAILPLCNERDIRTHVRWGLIDFAHRFGRPAEGMWLPETAVNDAVLAVLAEEGVRFTILAPGQIAGTRPLGSSVAWRPHGRGLDEGLGPVDLDDVDPRPLDTTRAYRWRDATRRDLGLDLIVYDGALAHALAFGHPTAAEIVQAAADHAGTRGGMVAAAIDGETFGHHHPGAEKELIRALTDEARLRGVRVPRLADVLAERPPTHEARVRESAWSCAHGVGRWQRDCGCYTGGEPGWDQAWRTPLRQALDVLRDWGIDVVDRLGPRLLRDPWVARDAYLRLLLGAQPWDDFAAEHVVGDHHHAGLLLDAQRNALLMYTSCGWFFNDLAGIETVQILRYAARAIDLYQQLGEEPPVTELVDVLGRAHSNDPDAGDGRRIWQEQVLPRP